MATLSLTRSNLTVPSPPKGCLVTDRAMTSQRSLRFLFPASLVCCGAVLIACGFDPRDLQHWLQQRGAMAPVFFIGVGIIAMTVLVPKTLVSITAGALFGTLTGSLLMLVIAVAAAATNHAIGRWWLHDSICRRLNDSEGGAGNEPTFDQPRSTMDWLHAIADLAGEAGFRLHLLIRLMPIPTTLISYVMGAMGSKRSPFLLAAAVAVLPQTLWVHAGTAATMMDDSSTSQLRWVGIMVSILAAIAVGVIIPKAAIKRIESYRHGKFDEADCSC